MSSAELHGLPQTELAAVSFAGLDWKRRNSLSVSCRDSALLRSHGSLFRSTSYAYVVVSCFDVVRSGISSTSSHCVVIGVLIVVRNSSHASSCYVSSLPRRAVRTSR